MKEGADSENQVFIKASSKKSMKYKRARNMSLPYLDSVTPVKEKRGKKKHLCAPFCNKGLHIKYAEQTKSF